MEGSGRPVAMLVVGAACISFAPILVRVSVDGGLGPTATGFWRCAIGAIVLVVLAAWRRAPLRLPARAIAAAALAGLAFFTDLWVWHRSIRDAGAGLATILGNTQVFLTALFGVWLFREPVGARFFGAAVAAIVGVTLLVGIASDVQWSGTYIRGVTYGLLTGVVYATFLLAMRIAGRESRGRSPLGVMVWMTASATVPLGVAAFWEPGEVIPEGSRAWAAVIGLALIAQSFGWWSISRSLPRVPAAIAGLVLLLQPVLATVWGIVLLDEQLDNLQVVGAAVTIAAIYYGATRSAVPSRA